MEDHTVRTVVQHSLSEGITIKIEPMEILHGDISQDTNITEKRVKHKSLLPSEHKVEISIDVKSEPVDVDDVCTSGAAGSAGPADVAGSPGVAATAKQEMDIGTTELQPCNDIVDHTVSPGVQHAHNEPPQVIADRVTIKIEPMDVIDGDISRDTIIAVKHEEDGPQHSSYCKGGISTDVKSEPADVDDVCSDVPANQKTTKEMDIVPTDLPPPNIQYMMRTCEPEPVADTLLGTCYQTEAQPVYAAKQLHTVAVQDSIGNLHMNQCTLKMLQISANSEQRLHRCDDCRKTFKCLHNLVKHKLTHQGEISYKSFTSKDDNKGHMLTHRSERPFKCDVCFKIFKTKPCINKHMMTHTDGRKYQCEICCKFFQLQRNFKRHIATHSGERKHKCDICFKSYQTNYHLKRHMVIHKGELNHKCDICLKDFLSEYYLKRHQVTHATDLSHKCNICFKRYQSDYHLKRHTLTHTSEQIYSCEICLKTFKTSCYLKRHMLTHTIEQKHQCDICRKTFKTSSHLKGHLLTHNAVRKYECDICGKSFIRKSHLKVHILIHTERKPHSFKSFSTKANREQHIL